ncbi:MAG: galactokinase [Lentimicrobium sp.]|nr:galactokinase [Lentimicrobium sp.]
MKENEVRASFEKKFGGDYRIFAAPGRINIIGEHTDYNEGFVLPAAIDKRIYVAIRPVNGSIVTINSVDFDQTINFNPEDELPDLPHWALYPFGVVKELQKQGLKPGAFEAAFGGDIPDGAGLSSSAALESAFATALNHLFDLGLSKMALAKTGQSAEHNYAGVRCGIMDQFASIYGRAGHVMKLDCRSLEYEYFPLDLGKYSLMLIDTRVKHSLAVSEYNSRRNDCEEGVMILQSQMPQVRSLRDVRPKDIYPYKGMMGEEIFLRCEYVTEENERVTETCKALTEGDLDRVGRLMYASHKGLRNKYNVSCAELDLLVDTARTVEGVLGARMMGGGFGGCTINLVKSENADTFRKVTKAAFFQKFGTEPAYYQVNTGDGAGESGK